MMPGQDRYSWQKAVARSALPPTARLVAWAVSLYTDPTGAQGVWLSSSEIARTAGLRSIQTVNVALRRLANGGWLRTEDSAWFLAFPGEHALAVTA